MKHLIAPRSAALALLPLLISAFPAQATPPDSLEIHDTLLAASRDHVFLLRSSRDNLGVYDADHRDLFLVALSRETGRERLWPVQRVTARSEDGTEPKLKARVEPLGGGVEPFAVLAHFGAMPLWPLDLEPMELGGRAEAVELMDPSGLAASEDKASLVARLGQSLEAFLANLEPYGRLGPLSPVDLLTISYKPEQCGVTEPVKLADRLGTSVYLIRMTCRLSEDEPAASLIQLLTDGSGP